MSRTFCLWFALRQFYRGGAPIARAVNLLTLLGTALGLSTLITLITLQRGLEAFLINKSIRYMPHAWITSTQAGALPTLPKQLQKAVIHIEPLVMEEVVLYHQERVRTAQLIGFQKGDPLWQELDPPRLIGSSLAQELNAQVGDRLTICPRRAIGPRNLRGILAPPVQITGLITTESTADKKAILLPWEEARTLLRYAPGQITGWRLQLHSPLTPPDAKGLDPRWRWHDWREIQPTLAQAIGLGQRAMQLLLATLLLICFLNVLTGQGLAVLSKTSDIAILKCLGASERMLFKIFVAEGLITLIGGALLGILCGISLLTLTRLLLPLLQLPSTLLLPLPLMLSDPKLLAWSATHLLVSGLGILYPARQASRLPPIKALCHE